MSYIIIGLIIVVIIFKIIDRILPALKIDLIKLH